MAVNRKIVRAASVLILGLSALFLSGCGAFGGSEGGTGTNTGGGSVEEFRLTAPYVLSFGSFLSWAPCKNAETYTVYCGDSVVGTTEQTRFDIVPGEEDLTYTVVANSVTRGVSSSPSNEAVVGKISGFAEEEILDLSGQTPGTLYTVSSDVRKVVCISDSPVSYNTRFVLQSRTQDIVFELQNVTFRSSGDAVIITENKTYSRARENWNLILDISGECSLEGIDHTALPAQPASDSEKRGTNGTAGTDGVLVPTAIVRGGGTLHIIGGDGGPGGKGADSTFWAAKYYGDGGNGGDGGDGVICQYFVMQMDDIGKVYLSGGAGGTRGAPGNNGSIITGPWNTSNYNEHYGASGAAGTSLRGEVITQGGTLYE